MRNSKKFISFMCSCAIAASAFSGVIVASAETTDTTSELAQGIVLKYDEGSSTSEKAVIIAEAVGVATIDAWQVNLVPEDSGVVISSGEVEEGSSPFDIKSNLSGATYKVIATGDTAQNVSENSVLATITLNFDNPLQEDTTVKLDVGSALEAKDEDGTPVRLYLDGEETDTLTASTVTVLANPTPATTATPAVETATPAVETATPTETAEPVATPYVTTRPTAIPIGEPVETVAPSETATPSETVAPIETAAPVTQGIKLEYDAENSTSEQIVIVAKAVGVATIDAWQVNLVPSDSNVVISEGSFEEGNSPFDIKGNLSGTTYKVIATGDTAQNVTENDVLATITLKLTAPLSVDAKIELTVGSALEAKDAEGNPVRLYLDGAENDTLGSTFIIALANPNPTVSESPAPSATATSEPEFEGDDEVKFSDILVDVPDTMDGGSLIAAVVDVTNGSSAAEYGEDFVAEYNGEQLTEDEYFNLINGYSRNGYGDGDMKDVIDNLTFLIKDGVTVTASPAYQTTEQAAENLMTVYPAYEGVYPPESTEEPEDGMVTLTVDTPSHGAITVTYTDADGNSVSLDTDDEDIEEEIPAGTSVRLRAIADNGYDFSRWGGDISGTSSPKTITVNRDTDVSATFTRTGSNSSSGGSSNSGSTGNGNSAGGGIARPNGGTGVVTPGINFTDLGSVQWAQPAINYLVSAGIINGRSNTIFDPNASVTRAEFAKMVCATFGISATPNAAQTFVDVSPSDWFYGYVQAAAANGIVNGVSETAFDPNATITREQMAAMLYRAIEATGNLAKLPAGTATVFADEAQIADYAKTYVSALNAAGVINGTSATTFEPKATATRAQAAAIIYQFLKAVGTV